MDFLYFLESIRTPIADAFMLLVTELGSEALFLAVALCMFWCVDKKSGYYVLFVGFLGIALNQFLKISFRIERPWVRDPDFTFVGDANVAATGYSFPSGHTQNVAGVLGALAYYFKKKSVTVISLTVIALVAFSRMYLGVHTPLDVVTSLVLAAVLVVVIYPIIMRAFENEKVMYILMGVFIMLGVLYLCYTEFFPFPEGIDVANYDEARKNAYSLLGAVAAFPIIYICDKKWIKFETDACLWGQIVKLVFGAALAVMIKSLLKAPLALIFDGHLVSNAVRYFAIVIFSGIIWPMTFRFYPKKRTRSEKNTVKNTEN